MRANPLSYRTFNPMTAATYGSGESSPWAHRDGRRYIVLRNPWGNTEATYGQLAGTAWFHDVSWWRPIALGDPDGVFALRVDVFKLLRLARRGELSLFCMRSPGGQPSARRATGPASRPLDSPRAPS